MCGIRNFKFIKVPDCYRPVITNNFFKVEWKPEVLFNLENIGEAVIQDTYLVLHLSSINPRCVDANSMRDI